MPEEALIPESEVNKMLGDQLISFKLERLDETCNEINKTMLSHIAMETKDSLDILTKIDEGSADRRKCEANLRTDMQKDRDFNHKTFVKISDLKKWGIVISITVAVITWVGNQSNKNSYDDSMTKIVKILESKVTK